MFPSPLNLKGYMISEASFKCKEGFSFEYNIDNARLTCEQIHYVRPEEDIQHVLRLKINLKARKNRKFPYSLSLDISGAFEVSSSFEGDKGLLADINGSSILFGAAREYIYMMTAHALFGPVTLPTTSFKPASLPPMSDRETADIPPLPDSE